MEKYAWAIRLAEMQDSVVELPETVRRHPFVAEVGKFLRVCMQGCVNDFSAGSQMSFLVKCTPAQVGPTMDITKAIDLLLAPSSTGSEAFASRLPADAHTSTGPLDVPCSKATVVQRLFSTLQAMGAR